MTCNIKNTVKGKVVLVWTFALLSLFYVITAIIFTEDMTEAVTEAISDSVFKVIPAIFPFMVISKFMVKTDIISVFDKLIGKTVTRIFNVSRGSSSALILSLLSGFPIGASVVSELYKTGRLTKNEAEVALCLTHNTGPAFPISVIGLLLWDSLKFGAAVYASQVISLVILSRLFGKGSTRKTLGGKAYSDGKPISHSLTSSLSESAISCVVIGGSIVFWKTVSELFFKVVPIPNPYLNSLISGFFEFSSGTLKASQTGTALGAALTGFFIGFGGLCVFLQAVFHTSQADLSMKKCLIFKLTHGILCGSLSCASYYLIF